MESAKQILSNKFETYTDSDSEIKIYHHVQLHDKNWFQTGGAARYYCEPTTANEFKTALNFAKEKNIEMFVLGEGANVLICDQGFDGLLIHPQNKNIAHTFNNGDAYITAGAGASIDNVISYSLKNNMCGMEEFSCIPGSIGGAVYINLHYFDFFIGNFLTKATVIEKSTGKIMEVDQKWFNFDYDSTTLHSGQYFLIDATFKVKHVSDIDCAYNRGRYDEITRYRKRQYPTSHTCGSFFRNFKTEEVTLEINDSKMIHVAYYLDKIGVKGNLTIGDATVSHKHANMVFNKGNATSSDIVALARTMQKLVKREYGIIPQPECVLVGFKKYPLLT